MIKFTVHEIKTIERAPIEDRPELNRLWTHVTLEVRDGLPHEVSCRMQDIEIVYAGVPQHKVGEVFALQPLVE